MNLNVDEIGEPSPSSESYCTLFSGDDFKELLDFLELRKPQQVSPNMLPYLQQPHLLRFLVELTTSPKEADDRAIKKSFVATQLIRSKEMRVVVECHGEVLFAHFLKTFNQEARCCLMHCICLVRQIALFSPDVVLKRLTRDDAILDLVRNNLHKPLMVSFFMLLYAWGDRHPDTVAYSPPPSQLHPLPSFSAVFALMKFLSERNILGALLESIYSSERPLAHCEAAFSAFELFSSHCAADSCGEMIVVGVNWEEAFLNLRNVIVGRHSGLSAAERAEMKERLRLLLEKGLDDDEEEEEEERISPESKPDLIGGVVESKSCLAGEPISGDRSDSCRGGDSRLSARQHVCLKALLHLLKLCSRQKVFTPPPVPPTLQYRSVANFVDLPVLRENTFGAIAEDMGRFCFREFAEMTRVLLDGWPQAQRLTAVGMDVLELLVLSIELRQDCLVLLPEEFWRSLSGWCQAAENNDMLQALFARLFSISLGHEKQLRLILDLWFDDALNLCISQPAAARKAFIHKCFASMREVAAGSWLEAFLEENSVWKDYQSSLDLALELQSMKLWDMPPPPV